MEKNWDAIVIGGGPAGSTVAKYAAKEGVKVLVIDSRDKIGSPLQCGELVPTNNQLRKLCPYVPEIDDLFDKSIILQFCALASSKIDKISHIKLYCSKTLYALKFTTLAQH